MCNGRARYAYFVLTLCADLRFVGGLNARKAWACICGHACAYCQCNCSCPTSCCFLCAYRLNHAYCLLQQEPHSVCVRRDFVALYAAGQPARKYLDYKQIDKEKEGKDSGSLEFVSPLSPFQIFLDANFDILKVYCYGWRHLVNSIDC